MKCRHIRSILVAVVFIIAAGCAILSPLMEASRKGDTDQVQALLAKGADVNAKDNDGFTALMWAAFYDRTETVQALLAKGADVNAKENHGATALMGAKRKGHKEIVRILKQSGAKE